MRFKTKISCMQFGERSVTDGPFAETKELFGGSLRVAAVRRHISPFEISRVRTLGPGEQKPGAKPKGLWYDLEGEWERWCREEGTRWVKPESVRYRLKPDHSVMLLLSTAASLRKFSGHYRLGKHAGADKGYIDWSRVASEYAGIEIAPYQSRLASNISWYNNWHVASGCIWDTRAILGLEPEAA